MQSTFFYQKDIDSISKIPFNEKKHKQAIGSGWYKTYRYENSLILERLHADKIGEGFGTAVFRKIMTEIIVEESKNKSKTHDESLLKTEITTSYGSPHLFYLYMGMSPNSYKYSYIKYEYGERGVFCLDKLSQCEDLTIESLEQLSNGTIQSIKEILGQEDSIESDKISFTDIIRQKDFLLMLKEKTIDYLEDIFIPDILEQTKKGKYQDTKKWGAMQMHLTEAGYKRWKYVIENNLEFVPFKDFEHIIHRRVVNDFPAASI